MAPRKPKAKSQSDQIRENQAAAAEGGRKDDGLPKNNLQAVREAEEKGLHKLLADLRPMIAEVEAASAIVKGKREAVNKRLDQGVADGHPKGLVRKMLAETAVTGERKNQREEWEREVRYREYLGLPARTQADMEDRMPEASKDEQDWIGAGYGSGLRGDSCDPVVQKVPDRFHQKWMEAWGEGQTKLAMSLGKPESAPKASLGVIEGGKGKPTDVGAETLAAIGEAEPEIVGQAIEDHGTDEEQAHIEAQRAEDEASFETADPANSEPV